MNQNSPTNLKSLSEQLKPLNPADYLVEMGIFGSTKTAANLRSNGTGPDYVRIKGTGIRYTKEAVLAWFSRSAR